MQPLIFWSCAGVFASLGVLGGIALSSLFIAKEPPTIPVSAEECYAALASAQTELTAEILADYCFAAFPGFLDGKAMRLELEAKLSHTADIPAGFGPVVAAVTSQNNTEGFSEAHLDMDVLSRLEDWVADTTKEKLLAEYAARGLDVGDVENRIVTESLYLTIQGKKLALVKTNMAELVRHVTIFGFKGDQFNRVTCIQQGGHDIPLSRGQCAEKIYEAFGVRLAP